MHPLISCSGKVRSRGFTATTTFNEILTSTGVAGVVVQGHAAIADPSALARRNSSDERIVRYVASDNGAGSNKCITADGCAADHGAVCSEGGALLH